jgi:hypothetical protein
MMWGVRPHVGEKRTLHIYDQYDQKGTQSMTLRIGLLYRGE